MSRETDMARPSDFDPARKVWPLCGYAPGNYTGECLDCGRQFQGDKRANQCLECAVVAANKHLARMRTAIPCDESAGLKDIAQDAAALSLRVEKLEEGLKAVLAIPAVSMVFDTNHAHDCDCSVCNTRGLLSNLGEAL